MHAMQRRLAALALALSAACVQVDPQPDFDRTQHLVQRSTGQPAAYDPYAPPLTATELDALIADGLRLDEALRIALLNNRELQAAFQSIGIAHADWAQSRLLTNPSLTLLFRLPEGGGRSLIEATLGMQLLELWRLPVREQAAQQNLEATVLSIARQAGERLAETRNAYYAAVAFGELLEVARENVVLAERSHGAVSAMQKAGMADAFDENLARGPLLSAQLAVRTARIDADNAKRALAKNLSLDRAVGELELTDPLPEPAELDTTAEALVERALTARLDLRAFDRAIDSLEMRVRLERRKSKGNIIAGASTERPAGGGNTELGPSFGLTLPVFDQNQAQVSRAAFALERMVKLREAARVTVAQDIRSGADRVQTASGSLAFYNGELLPQAHRSLELAQESFSSGRTTLLSLVEAQRQLLEARRAHVTLRLEAATASSDLERVLGEPLFAP